MALSGASLAAPDGRSRARPVTTTTTRPPKSDPKTLTLSGHVEGLYPGARSTLTVSVGNPNPFAVRLASLRVDADGAGPGCPGTVITVDPPPTGAVIPAKGTAPVSVGIGMATTAPDACRGATFPLRYSATATQAR